MGVDWFPKCAGFFDRRPGNVFDISNGACWGFFPVRIDKDNKRRSERERESQRVSESGRERAKKECYCECCWRSARRWKDGQLVSVMLELGRDERQVASVRHARLNSVLFTTKLTLIEFWLRWTSLWFAKQNAFNVRSNGDGSPEGRDAQTLRSPQRQPPGKDRWCHA